MLYADLVLIVTHLRYHEDFHSRHDWLSVSIAGYVRRVVGSSIDLSLSLLTVKIVDRVRRSLSPVEAMVRVKISEVNVERWCYK